LERLAWQRELSPRDALSIVSAITIRVRESRVVASRGLQLADRGTQKPPGTAAAKRLHMTKLESITELDLSTINGGNRVTALADLISRLGKADLSAKQIGKLDGKLDDYAAKAAKKSGKGVPAIATGDFGSAPSSFIPITGD
jgi:hypothetical protein